MQKFQIRITLLAFASFLFVVHHPYAQESAPDASSVEQGKFTLHKFEQPIGEET